MVCMLGSLRCEAAVCCSSFCDSASAVDSSSRRRIFRRFNWAWRAAWQIKQVWALWMWPAKIQALKHSKLVSVQTMKPCLKTKIRSSERVNCNRLSAFNLTLIGRNILVVNFALQPCFLIKIGRVLCAFCEWYSRTHVWPDRCFGRIRLPSGEVDVMVLPSNVENQYQPWPYGLPDLDSPCSMSTGGIRFATFQVTVPCFCYDFYLYSRWARSEKGHSQRSRKHRPEWYEYFSELMNLPTTPLNWRRLMFLQSIS